MTKKKEISTHERYMQRCFELARLGAGKVSPNPMVGAVLVYQDRILGEGWHQQYGQAHAEVNALHNVREADRPLIHQSTLYVSLEPCNFFGKTPPCTDLILRCKIPRVVVSCLDKTPRVSGRGIARLREAGVEVITGVLARAGEELSSIRNTFAEQERPYVLLKYARSADGCLGLPGRQVWISNDYSRRLVHKLRSACDAIMVGTNTALIDNPRLDNRLWYGKCPLRIVLDRDLRIPSVHHLLGDGAPTLVITAKKPPAVASESPLRYHEIPFDRNLLPSLLKYLFECKISSLLVEGGSATMQHFLDIGCWDEALVLEGAVSLGDGIPAPQPMGHLTEQFRLGTDRVLVFKNQKK